MFVKPSQAPIFALIEFKLHKQTGSVNVGDVCVQVASSEKVAVTVQPAVPSAVTPVIE